MTDNKSNNNRRKLLKSIALGSGAVVTGTTLPESWNKPVIDSVVLPAHASTTNTQECGPFCGELKDGEVVYAFTELTISGTTVNLRACNGDTEFTGVGQLNNGSFNFQTTSQQWIRGTINSDCSGATAQFCTNEAGDSCSEDGPFTLSPGMCGICGG